MLKKDIDYKKCLVIAAAFILLRLFIASQQMVFIMPYSAPLDDDLYFNLANSIVSGNWLGEYNFLTLSKYPFFAVYLAALHTLKIPYLVGNCIMLIIGGALTVVCFAPILKTNWSKLALFLVFIYNPATYTSYNLRVYRDAIFPLLCTMFFVGLAGWALRLKKDIKQNIGFLVLAGVALGTAYITREDGYWLFPFAIVAVIICAVYIFTDKNLDKKLLRILSMGIPGLITAIFVITICSINNKYYGEFILTDFNSGSFASCYGAMTSLSQENWRPLVVVPEDVRERMYEGCESFAPFEEYLEDGPIERGYKSKELGDYQAGSFYWRLRRTAQELGVYENAQKADEFWSQLESEIERLWEKDENALPLRSSLTPPIKLEYVGPVINDALRSMVKVMTWYDVDSYQGSLSDLSTGQIEKWESFLHNKSNYSAIENTDIPYHTPIQNICYKFLDGVTWIYRVFTIPLLVFAFVQIFRIFAKFKNQNFEKQIMAFVLLGFVLMAVFRIFIISFMEIAAFNIGFYTMYLGAVYPLMVLVCFFGIILYKEN